MKNLGMTGGLVLVAAGLLVNAFVTFDDDVQAAIIPDKAFFKSDNDACFVLTAERWFEQEGSLLCTGLDGVALAYKNGFDMNGDSIGDTVGVPSASWTGGVGFTNGTEIESQRSYSVALIDGEWVTTFQPLTFDFMDLIPDQSLSWTVAQGLFDVDGDKKLDLIVEVRSDPTNPKFFQRTTWHRNITPGNPLAADINLDGIVNGIDLAIVLASWNTPG